MILFDGLSLEGVMTSGKENYIRVGDPNNDAK